MFFKTGDSAKADSLMENNKHRSVEKILIFFILLPLNGAGWLRSHIINHSIDTFDFIGDAV